MSIHIHCLCKNYSFEKFKNKLLTFANELWIGQTPTTLHNCGRKNNIKNSRCVILLKWHYINKGENGQYALKGNIRRFSQYPNLVVRLINIIAISLQSLSNVIAYHFVSNFHSSINVQQNYKLLYIQKLTSMIWLTWLKINYAYYNEMKTDQNLLKKLHDYNIPHIILRFKFKLTNIDLANIEH